MHRGPGEACKERGGGGVWLVLCMWTMGWWEGPMGGVLAYSTISEWPLRAASSRAEARELSLRLMSFPSETLWRCGRG